MTYGFSICRTALSAGALAAHLAALPALADPPAVEGATLSPSGAEWRVSVTLRHPDTGWDHYADGWRIETPDGTVLGTRELLHPHVNEQPFTRSHGGVTIPASVDHVMIRAKCSVDGWSDTATEIAVPR